MRKWTSNKVYPSGRLFSLARAAEEFINRRSYRQAVLRGLLPLIEDGARILDVGCDDGRLSWDLMRCNPTLHIAGVDVQTLHPPYIPKVIYNGSCLPFPDASFDVAMAVDVLHHTPDTLGVLKEMVRVSGRYVLIKDLVWRWRKVGWLLMYLTEWCSNAPFGIGQTCTFLQLRDWLEVFDKLELKPKAMAQIAHFPFRLNEKFNWIFLLEKENSQGM